MLPEYLRHPNLYTAARGVQPGRWATGQPPGGPGRTRESAKGSES